MVQWLAKGQSVQPESVAESWQSVWRRRRRMRLTIQTRQMIRMKTTEISCTMISQFMTLPVLLLLAMVFYEWTDARGVFLGEIGCGLAFGYQR